MKEEKILKVLCLADGIASGREVFKRLGIKVIYHAVEIEEWKRKIADDNHAGIVRPFNDILLMAEQDEMEFYDFVIAGPTCTSLSSQGKREDWDGASQIFFDCLEILEKCKVANPNLFFMFENVSSMKNVIREEISSHLNATAFLGNSALVSGQERKRYYWFNWSQPIIEDKGIMGNDCLDEDGLHMFSFSKSNRNKKDEAPIVEGRFKANDKAGTLVTGKGCRGQSTMNQVITKKMKIRDLTVSECARLMGLHDYKFDCSDMKAYEAIGDGWSIGMVTEIFKACPLIQEGK